MLSETQYANVKTLMGSIVANSLPGEYDAFLLTDEKLIKGALVNGKRLEVSARGQTEFGLSLKETIEFVSLLLGTYKVIKELWKLVSSVISQEPKPDSVQVIIDSWKKNLELSGLPPEKAEMIATKYAVDLIVAMKDKK